MAGSADEPASRPHSAGPGSPEAGHRRHAAPETTPSLFVPEIPPNGQTMDPDAARADFSSPVRPYFFTRGRTRSTVELEIETLVSVVPGAARPSGAALTAFEHCHEARSVAEVAALMSVPLGVARVLLGDLAEAGAVVVHGTATTSEGPALALMQRVLIGLRNL